MGVVKLLIGMGAIFVVAAGATGLLFALSAPPTTHDLDLDIAQVREQIVTAEVEEKLYSSSLLKTLIIARIDVLRINEAFLKMKRDSLLRRIDLRYTVDGVSFTSSPEHISNLESEIEKMTVKLAESNNEASRYTGGLVQSLVLARAATYDLTLAQLNLSLMAERHGFLVQIPSASEDNPVTAPIGQTVVGKDGDAL